jgi:hypothetical protein
MADGRAFFAAQNTHTKPRASSANAKFRDSCASEAEQHWFIPAHWTFAFQGGLQKNQEPRTREQKN